jgi:hypothetical protein
MTKWHEGVLVGNAVAPSPASSSSALMALGRSGLGFFAN